jgi:acetyl/propionyl-CoA carboxylase alpha subunit
MEMNTRLQIEHVVTELVSGVAIVDAQYEIAAGGSISGMKAGETGYAMEVRVNADRPARGADGTLAFSPNAGTVTECVLPKRAEVTLLSAIRPGSVISPYYDSMIVQVIAHGKDRADTISTLDEYLSGVRIEGVYTNLALLRAILRDDIFRGGKYDTTYLPRFIARLDVDKLLEETERAAALPPRKMNREKIEISGSDELRVLAPQAGIFYRAVSPSEPDLIREGDHISIDRPFGLLEVMKTFVTLTLDSFNREGEKLYAGGKYEVVRISATNARQVNPGDLLLVVKPLLK